MTLATTRVSLYRGSIENALGDEDDDNTVPQPGFADIPASVIEYDKRVQDPNSGMWQTVRRARGRLRSGLDIIAGDRLKDNRSGRFYLVSDVLEKKRSLAGMASIVLDLMIVAGTALEPGTPVDALGAIVELTQAEYDALVAADTVDPNTFYAITD